MVQKCGSFLGMGSEMEPKMVSNINKLLKCMHFKQFSSLWSVFKSCIIGLFVESNDALCWIITPICQRLYQVIKFYWLMTLYVCSKIDEYDDCRPFWFQLKLCTSFR